MSSPSARRTVPIALLALAGAGLVTALPTAAEAAPVGVRPVRTIPVGTSISAFAVAANGTLYVPGGSGIDVWSPASDGEPVVTKTFTGTSVSGAPSLSPSAGLAYADANAGSVVVLDPAQPDGPAVPTRTITGPATQIDSPLSVGWTASGSLWVVDTVVAGKPGMELLRFAPGAVGDVAPVRQISGTRTRLQSGFGQVTIAGLPGDGVAVSPVGVTPRYSVFTSGQSGNVAPSRSVQVQTSTPHWLSQGIAADPQGRVYLGSGQVEGQEFGRLDVFGPTASGTARPLVTLGGSQQRFQVPLVPSVAGNGTLALLDATVLVLGGTSQVNGEVQVFRPLFTKPGTPGSLSVRKSSSTATITWQAGSNPSGTPVTYRVVVKKGTRTLVSRTVSSRSLALKRSSLPSGTLRVAVTAVNIGGTSAGVSKAFTK